MGSATDLEGLCLRYGVLYGPGTAFAEGVSLLDRVRKHRLPVVGSGTGVCSFVHVDDAARATVWGENLFSAKDCGRASTHNPSP